MYYARRTSGWSADAIAVRLQHSREEVVKDSSLASITLANHIVTEANGYL